MHFQLAADVLVIPYDSRLSTAAWCSPLKMWEYLASGRPIVAFPIPALRDIFRKSEVVWVQEETPVSLADALKEAMKWEPRPLHEIRERIGTWTWEERARRIAEFMEILQ
jgi:glycosyltransferase involved in cell wall biosynthesis